ncbi:MAG: gliding motility protein GldN [Bacteroidota bacterium]
MKKIIFSVFMLAMLIGFKLPVIAQVIDGPRDAIYDKTTISQVDPIPYVYIRETDVIWSKRIWRELDMHEKINQPFYYPTRPQNGWKSFAQIIIDGIKEGTLNAYSPMNDQFTMPLTWKEMNDKYTTSKTIHRVNPDNPDEVLGDTTIVDELKVDDIKMLTIKEDWVFDKQRSVQEGRILGICLKKDKLDQQGNIIAPEDICWVYFPDCRNLLSKHQQFNLKNGAAGRLSYDEVFMKRMFASYIVKTENVYDRFINSYETGVGALLEAERAKKNLFEFEQNAWEY